MVAGFIAWVLAFIFLSGAVEKALVGEHRRNFLAASERLLPKPLGRPLGLVFLLGEGLAAPLLWFLPRWGVAVLVVLCAIITAVGIAAWRRGETKSCPCGGIWAATGSRLALRNVLLLGLALYAWTAPGLVISWQIVAAALAGLIAVIIVAGLIEGVRMHLRS